MRRPDIDSIAREAYGLRHVDRARAKELALTAHGSAAAIGYEFGIGQALLALGTLAYQAREPESIDLSLAALEILARHDKGGGAGGRGSAGYEQARTHALVQNLLAVHHCAWGGYETMSEHVRIAHAIGVRIGDREIEALAIGNMAEASERAGDYDAAIRYHEEARRIAHETGDELRYWIATMYQAEARALAGQYAKALPEMILACEAPVLRETQFEVEGYTNLASLYLRLDRFRDSADTIAYARRLAEAGDHRSTLCGVEEVAGRLAAARGYHEEAIARFRRVVDLSELHDRVANRSAALRGIVDACRRLGRFEEALVALDEIVALKETHLTEQSAERTHALMIAHRLEWDRREADLMRHQKDVLAQVNVDVRAILVEKDTLHDRLRHQATTDELTGLPNRRSTSAVGEAAFERFLTRDVPLSVAILDVDRFKLVNDTHGHATGDEILRILAVTCRAAMRSGDVFGRWGGEEFLCLYPSVGIEAAREASERIRQAVRNTSFGDLYPAGSVTVSIGVMQATDHRGFDELVRAADAALYRAKREGRDRVCVGEMPESLPKAEGTTFISDVAGEIP